MTDNHNHNPSDSERLASLSESADSWLAEISDRDVALGILSPDYETQLSAIQELLLTNREVDDAEVARLRQLEELGGLQPGESIAEDRVDQLHRITFQEAAHSMAAVGLLAPFVESVFVHAFRHFERQAKKKQFPSNLHERWQHPAEDQWDCHYVWKKGRRRRDIVRGIMQLANALGMEAHLPNDLHTTLSALFAYRNRMFHNGFEWPREECQQFSNRIHNENWSHWFSRAQSGDRPWIFYMTRIFVDHCFDTIDEILDGIGAYCRTR